MTTTSTPKAPTQKTSIDETSTSAKTAVADGGSPNPAWGSGVPSSPSPVGAPAAAVTGVITAVVLLGLGVVGIRDGLVAAGALSGSLWTVSTAETVSGARPTAWVLVGGIVAVLLGLWFVVSALRPRPATGLKVSATSSVWVTPRDAARLSVGSVTQVPGVTGASASASRRKLVLTVTGESGGTDLDAAVRESATTALAALETAPAIRVRSTASRTTGSAS